MNGLVVLCEAISPISHAARTEGNESVVNRRVIRTSSGLRAVPVLSGNAIRHRMIRSSGARWLIDRLGLAGQLDLTQLNFFMHGGNLAKGEGGFEDTRLIGECQSVFPLIALVGGAIPSQILTGSLLCSQGVLLCEEERDRLPEVITKALPDRLLSAETFIGGYQYTRSSVEKSSPDLLPSNADHDSSNLMIFAGQHVIPGAIFSVEFTIARGNKELLMGCVLKSISEWIRTGGTIGGMASRGHGRLSVSVVRGPDEAERSRLIEEYQQYVDDHAEQAKRWLSEVFSPRKEKEKKGKS